MSYAHAWSAGVAALLTLASATAASAAPISPSAVAVGPEGVAYVGDLSTGKVQTFKTDGTRDRVFGSYGAVAELDVDKDTGLLYVLDATNTVFEVDPATGATKRSFSVGDCTEAASPFLRGGVSVAGSYVFAASVCGDDVVRVNKSDLGGRLRWTVDDPGGLSYNQWASAGYKVAVTRPNAKDVQLFTDTGTLVRTQVVGGRAADAELDDYSVLVVSDNDRDQIHLYGSDGVEFRTLGGPGTAAGKLDNALGIDLFWQYGGDLAGNIFVAEYGNQRVQRWSSGGYTFYASPTTDAAGGTPGGGDPGGGDPGGGDPGGGDPGGGTPDPTDPIGTQRVGITVNGGALYTSSRSVTLSIKPPEGTTSLWLSNDGGFANLGSAGDAVRTPLNAGGTYTWTLPSSGNERLPKTVYVRFRGSANEHLTLSDDIVLDQTAPSVTSATVAPAASAAAASAAPLRKATVRVRGKDANSGVAYVQVARRPGRQVVTKRASKSAAKVVVKGLGARPYVRVIDRAGNVSRWVRARVK